MVDLVIRNGRVATPAGLTETDVAIDAGLVVGLGAAYDAKQVIDAAGALVGPGLVDIHTHLREPGEEWKEDIESGSAAGAAGGYTALVAMPNTVPPIDAGHLARYVQERGRRAGRLELATAGCITAGRQGRHLAHLDDLWEAGVRVFTDDGDGVADSGVLREAMDYLAERGGMIAQHAEDPGLARGGHMHEGSVSSRLGMVGIPRESEELMVARDLALVRLTGCRYHVQHVSAAGTLGLIAAAKREGLPVTAEVSPHHLAFDHQRVATFDPVYKMYPPLRSPRDVAALREALIAGLIDAVATDHAPHAAHETEVPFEEAPRGVIGLETAAAAVNTFVGLPPIAFFERMAVVPARLAGLSNQGRWVEMGSPAHLVIFDHTAEWTPTVFRSKSANSPFRGVALKGRVRATVFDGRLAYQLETTHA